MFKFAVLLFVTAAAVLANNAENQEVSEVRDEAASTQKSTLQSVLESSTQFPESSTAQMHNDSVPVPIRIYAKVMKVMIGNITNEEMQKEHKKMMESAYAYINKSVKELREETMKLHNQIVAIHQLEQNAGAKIGLAAIGYVVMAASAIIILHAY